MSRRMILFGVLLPLSAALAGYLLVGRSGEPAMPPRTTHDYIAVSGRIDTGMPYREVVALIGKPGSNMIMADTGGADPTTLTPAQLRAARVRFTEWDIGKEGEGDFWTRIFPRDHPLEQHLTVMFDRNDRVASKSIRTDKDYMYED